jgi:predicted dehydrogenase
MKDIGIGIVGIGFMGMIHYLAAQRLSGGRVTALCSRDRKKLEGDWTSIQGNFGPRGTMMDLSGHALHTEFEALLADPGVDLVDLCVPNAEHAQLAIRALEAGKHVLVEKPIALTVQDADAMLAAATTSGKQLMVAHVLPFFPEFSFAIDAVCSGHYGALKAAHLTRVISRPDWSADIASAARSGGPAIDLHIHDTHFLGLLCGVPKAVHSRGVVEGDAVVYLATQYLYDEADAPAVTCVSGAISQAGRPFAHGFDLALERATLSFGFASLGTQGLACPPLSVILPDGTVENPTLGSSDPIDSFTAELTVAVESVRRGASSAQLSGSLARQALVACLAEVESVKTRRTVELG